MNILLVAVGGAIGATARHLLTTWMQSQTGTGFPWGTLIANITGSFLIGIVVGLVSQGTLSDQARLLLAVGILGGYTTFSSFSHENLQLIEKGSAVAFLLNTFGQVALGITVAYLGVLLARNLG